MVLAIQIREPQRTLRFFFGHYEVKTNSIATAQQRSYSWPFYAGKARLSRNLLVNALLGIKLIKNAVSQEDKPPCILLYVVRLLND